MLNLFSKIALGWSEYPKKLNEQELPLSGIVETMMNITPNDTQNIVIKVRYKHKVEP